MTPCLLLDFWVILMRNNWVTFQDSTKLTRTEQKLWESCCCVAGLFSSSTFQRATSPGKPVICKYAHKNTGTSASSSLHCHHPSPGRARPQEEPAATSRRLPLQEMYIMKTESCRMNFLHTCPFGLFIRNNYLCSHSREHILYDVH